MISCSNDTARGVFSPLTSTGTRNRSVPCRTMTSVFPSAFGVTNPVASTAAIAAFATSYFAERVPSLFASVTSNCCDDSGLSSLTEMGVTSAPAYAGVSLKRTSINTESDRVMEPPSNRTKSKPAGTRVGF